MSSRLAVLASLAVCGVALAEEAPAPGAGSGSPSHLVLVSEATRGLPEWRAVAEALVEKHGGRLVSFGSDVAEALPELAAVRPRHVAVVATPEEAGRAFVVALHQVMRRIDDDPYTDAFWGIVTGYEAADALAIARETDPLVIRRVVSGTELVMDRVESGVWFCELEQHRMVRKEKGREAEAVRGPADTTEAIVDALNAGTDLFVTSGHATERDWQIGFRYRNGYFKCADGTIFGEDTKGRRFAVDAPHPKVYLPIGNCLMGHIADRDSMAPAFMHSAGVRQMLGYVVETWFGYAGWGVLDYFVEQPGRFNFTEAFWANQHALVHRLETFFPEDKAGSGRRVVTGAAEEAGLGPMDARGLAFDRDVVAFYGDPAWEARLAPGRLEFDQSLVRSGGDDGEFVFRVEPLRGESSYEPVDTNGSQRGFRPFVAFLPERIDPQSVEILAGGERKPVIADDFILVPHPGKGVPAEPIEVRFRARRAE